MKEAITEASEDARDLRRNGLRGFSELADDPATSRCGALQCVAVHVPVTMVGLGIVGAI